MGRQGETDTAPANFQCVYYYAARIPSLAVCRVDAGRSRPFSGAKPEEPKSVSEY